MQTCLSAGKERWDNGRAVRGIVIGQDTDDSGMVYGDSSGDGKVVRF